MLNCSLLLGEDYFYRGDFYHDSKAEPHVEEQLLCALFDLISKYSVGLFHLLL